MNVSLATLLCAGTAGDVAIGDLSGPAPAPAVKTLGYTATVFVG